MPIIEQIKTFFKRIVERKIDPSLHHKEHETFYTIARGLQDQHDLTKKEAIKLASELLEKRETVRDLKDKGLSEKDAKKIAKKILKVPTVEISDIDTTIIEKESP